MYLKKITAGLLAWILACSGMGAIISNASSKPVDITFSYPENHIPQSYRDAVKQSNLAYSIVDQQNKQVGKISAAEIFKEQPVSVSAAGTLTLKPQNVPDWCNVTEIIIDSKEDNFEIPFPDIKTIDSVVVFEDVPEDFSQILYVVYDNYGEERSRFYGQDVKNNQFSFSVGEIEQGTWTIVPYVSQDRTFKISPVSFPVQEHKLILNSAQIYPVCSPVITYEKYDDQLQSAIKRSHILYRIYDENKNLIKTVSSDEIVNNTASFDVFSPIDQTWTITSTVLDKPLSIDVSNNPKSVVIPVPSESQLANILTTVPVKKESDNKTIVYQIYSPDGETLLKTVNGISELIFYVSEVKKLNEYLCEYFVLKEITKENMIPVNEVSYFLFPSKTKNQIYKETPPVLGDVNLDGSVTKEDIDTLKTFIDTQQELSQAEILAGDLNKNGEIDSIDLSILQEMFSLEDDEIVNAEPDMPDVLFPLPEFADVPDDLLELPQDLVFPSPSDKTNPNESPTQPPHYIIDADEMKDSYGIDVSRWQGDIDWNMVKQSGIEFAIIRAGFGNNGEDVNFRKNIENALAAKVDCGIYWYSYALTPEDAKAEAEACAKTIAQYPLKYPVMFDIEEDTQAALSDEEINRIIDTFCSTMESKGYYVSIYSYAYFLNTRVDPDLLRKYDVWVAHYHVPEPAINVEYGMWQYTNLGSVDGIEGNVDMDIAYKDYPEIMKKYQKNHVI